MKLRNKIEVAAPASATWQALLDVERFGRALPGATVERAADGSYRGRLRLRLGPITAEYAGAVRLEEVDEDTRTATFFVHGEDAHGQGTAEATIRNRVDAHGAVSRVTVETDLFVAGRAAQFGRGILEEVAARTLDQFARRLEAELTGADAARAEGDAVDLGTLVSGPLVRRALPLVGAFVAGIVVGRGVRRS